MNTILEEDVVRLDNFDDLRNDLRNFFKQQLDGTGRPAWIGSWDGFDRDFSRALGERGWLGMAMPKQYGGQERSVLERYVVMEELLAAGAPVACHWVADRQAAPNILRFGTETQRNEYIPRISRGELCFAIGMSEPDSGSDLASVKTRATPADGGWVVNGRKIWSSNAHQADYMIAIVRTEEQNENRHAGLSQFLLDLKQPGISVAPIENLAGDRHFNEVVFDDVFVPHENVLGEPGNGWDQVVSELAFERSGPDRFLSTFRLLVELVRIAGNDPSDHIASAIGSMVARIWATRRTSIQVAAVLERGDMPNTEAALVKDLGTAIEQETPELARLIGSIAPNRLGNDFFEALLEYDTLHTPSFSIRGGTREVMRGIIARGIGLR